MIVFIFRSITCDPWVVVIWVPWSIAPKKVGTNGLLSTYSLRGRRKRAFGDLNVCQIITKACLLNFKHAKVTDVESLIGATLKFAPHRGKQQKKPIEDHREQPDH
ncbi:hypothetical protein AAFF_G00388520 [Aldrovandia affinis]|uniref:Uncharacterized protein n=1 Tax=Aldrovandia affinis TaxID=143900 RepID=A0AAD7VYX7_9TELE|nr:hypothetical protein AAFF_G00388520 [Aldrovandia affinis]